MIRIRIRIGYLLRYVLPPYKENCRSIDWPMATWREVGLTLA